MATADEFLDAPVKVSADQFLDQGGTASSTVDKFLDEGDTSVLDTVKTGVKAVAGLPMKALRGYEAMGVGAAKLISGDRPQEALATAAEATQPGFDPEGVAENVGSFVGGNLPFAAIPVGQVVSTASRAAKLIHAAKVGGLFGVGLSTLDTLEQKGSISMDDAENIAINGAMTAVIGGTAEAILGPVLSRFFKRKPGGGQPPAGPSGPSASPEPPPYKPSAAAMKARGVVVPEHVAKNAEELTQLVKVQEKLQQHAAVLTPEAQAMLGEINKEVGRLTKLDKTYTTKQMLKEMGQDVGEMTPAKAENVLVRMSAKDFKVAAMTDKGIVTDPEAVIHGQLEIPKGQKLVDMGYVDQSGKFFSREEAAKAINPEYKVGDAIHSPQMQSLQKLSTMSQEELRVEQMRMSTERNKLWHDKYEKLPGTVAERTVKYKQDPAVKELDAIDLELHKLMKDKSATPVEPVAEPENFIPVERFADDHAKVLGDNVFFSPRGQGTNEYGSKKLETFIDPAKLYTDSDVVSFFEKRKLLDKPIPEKYRKLYKGKYKTLRDLKENPQFEGNVDDQTAWYDVYQQYAADILKKEGKSGAHWTNEDDMLSPDQYQIWDPSIIHDKKLSNALKLKDLTPTLNTNKGMIQGIPGQELDDLIAQHDLDVVTDNVIEGYTDKAGKFLTKEEVLGPTSTSSADIPGDKFTFKGKKAWSGIVNLADGKIEEVHPYSKAEAADFHHAQYMSDQAIDKIDAEEVSPFFIDKDGSIWNGSDDSLPQDIINKIKQQIKIISSNVPERSRLLNQWATETAQAAKDLGYKTSAEALTWAEKSHHYLPDDYKLAFQNKFNSLTKAEPKAPIVSSKPIVSATPIEVGESAPILKASEMMDAFNKELPPTAGANPEVADILDAARDASIGKKPKLKLEGGAPPVKPPKAPPTAAGAPEPDPIKKIFKDISDSDQVKTVIHVNEVPTENQLKVKADTVKSGKVKEARVPPSVAQASPSLPGTEMAPAFIPEFIAGSSNFRLGWYSRIAKQTRTVLEGMGNAGKELAARIMMVDDASAIRANDFLYNFDRLITQIPKGKREQAGIDLMDVLEGRKTSSNLLPEGMIELTQKMFGSYGDDAKALDFHILRQDGTKVDWAARTNFAPRMVKQEFIDGILRNDGVTLGRIKQYFLESKQVPTEAQASQKVQALRRRYMERRYGHLERAREYDLPPEFYDRQGFSVIPEYVRAASHRLEEVRQFGQHDVKVLELIDRIAAEGNDSVLARQIFDRYTGLEVADEVFQRGVQGIKNLVTGMSIQLPSTITQLGQVLTPIHRATSPDLGLGLAKAYGRAASALIRSFTKLGKEQAAKAGQGFESLATDFLLDTYGGTKNKPFGKFAETSLKLSGFSGEDSFWRRYSALLGRSHIEKELIPRIKRNGSDKYATVELRRLGLNPAIVRAQGGLSEAELNIAAKRFADQTQGAPNVLNLPLWWTSDTGRFMTQFHTFSLVIGKENYLLAKDMIRTGNVNRLISMGLGTPLVGAGISFMKEEMLGLKPNDFTGDKQTDQIIRWYINGTSFGVAADLMLSLTKGRSAFAGSMQAAAPGILGGLLYDVKEGLLGNKQAAKRAAQKIPVVGRVLFQ